MSPEGVAFYNGARVSLPTRQNEDTAPMTDGLTAPAGVADPLPREMSWTSP